MPLVTLKREIDIATVVKWTLGLAAALVWLTMQYMTVKDHSARLDKLEGGMDVKNGVMYLGQPPDYYKGAHEAMRAQGLKEEEE